MGLAGGVVKDNSDVVGAARRYQVQHYQPPTSQGRTKQKPEGAPLELRECEDNQDNPHQRKEHTHFDGLVHSTGCGHERYRDAKGRDDERREEQCSKTVAQGLNLGGCGIHVTHVSHKNQAQQGYCWRCFPTIGVTSRLHSLTGVLSVIACSQQ